MSTSISIKELKELDPSSYQIVDIRDAVEISHGAIPGALAMKTEEIETSDAIDRTKKTIICCSRGRFSVAGRRRSRTGKRSSFMYRKIEETPEREKMLIRLKELRLKRGYSMLQAARKIFSHLDTYNRYEKGIREIPLDSLMLLAKTYDCSLDYLAGISDQPRKYGK